MCDTDVTALFVVSRHTCFLVAASPPKAATKGIVPLQTTPGHSMHAPGGWAGEIGAEDGRTVVPL
jgi:hypothetical protein